MIEHGYLLYVNKECINFIEKLVKKELVIHYKNIRKKG